MRLAFAGKTLISARQLVTIMKRDTRIPWLQLKLRSFLDRFIFLRRQGAENQTLARKSI